MCTCTCFCFVFICSYKLWVLTQDPSQPRRACCTTSQLHVCVCAATTGLHVHGCLLVVCVFANMVIMYSSHVQASSSVYLCLLVYTCGEVVCTFFNTCVSCPSACYPPAGTLPEEWEATLDSQLAIFSTSLSTSLTSMFRSEMAALSEKVLAAVQGVEQRLGKLEERQPTLRHTPTLQHYSPSPSHFSRHSTPFSPPHTTSHFSRYSTPFSPPPTNYSFTPTVDYQSPSYTSRPSKLPAAAATDYPPATLTPTVDYQSPSYTSRPSKLPPKLPPSPTKYKLRPALDVIRDSERLIKSHNYSLVALKLAREAVFGPDVVSEHNFTLKGLDHLKHLRR